VSIRFLSPISQYTLGYNTLGYGQVIGPPGRRADGVVHNSKRRPCRSSEFTTIVIVIQSYSRRTSDCRVSHQESVSSPQHLFCSSAGSFRSGLNTRSTWRFSRLSAAGSCLPNRRSASDIVDLGAVAAFVRRQGHHRIMDRGINRQRAIDRLFRLFPPQIEGDSFTLDTFCAAICRSNNAALCGPGTLAATDGVHSAYLEKQK
jgi:hypothetical protein